MNKMYKSYRENDIKPPLTPPKNRKEEINMTNREWLNSLSDEEFTLAIEKPCDICLNTKNQDNCRTVQHECLQERINWLSEERGCKKTLQCPLCHGESEIVSDIVECETTYAIVCKECGLSLGIKNIDGIYVPSRLSLNDLINEWNTRNGDDK